MANALTESTGDTEKSFVPVPDNKEKLFKYLNILLLIFIGAHVFFNPFPQLTAIEEISFYGAVFLCLLLLGQKKSSFSFAGPLTMPLFLFFGWTIIGLFFALDQANTLHDIYAHFLKYIIFYFLLINYFNSFRRFEILWLLLIFSTAVFSVYLMIYFYLIIGNPFGVKLGFQMPWEIPPNFIGVLTIFATLLSINIYNFGNMKAYRWLLAIPAGILVITTIATKTRAAIISLFVGILAVFFRNKKSLLFFSLSLLLLIAFMPVKDRLSPSDLADKIRNDDRIQIWYTFWEIIKDHPFTGIGFGMETYHDENLLNRYNQRVPPAYRQTIPLKSPHNFFVDITVRTGFVGLMIFLFILWRYFRLAFRIIKYGQSNFVRTWAIGLVAAQISWMIQGMFESIVSGPAAKIFFIMLAMITILWNLRDQEDSTETGLV
jgi:O-antigen ligase